MNQKVKTHRSYVLVIFGAIFFIVGMGFLLWSVIPTIYDSYRMQYWSSVQGELISAKRSISRSQDSTTYQALAEYRYSVDGQSYKNDRVAINSGADNIGSFQSDLGRKLENSLSRKSPVTVYYNPQNPSDALLNREIRWGLLGFKMIFVLLFGGVGGGIMFWGYRGKRRIHTAETDAKPWLARPEWVNGKIRSNAKASMYVAIGIAIFWNLISTPILFMFDRIWDEQGAVGLLILLFPLVGLGLLYWAIKSAREWKRFGVTLLTMDPYPGSINGDVAGEITTSIPYAADLVVQVTLSSIYHYTSGSGKNRSTRENVNWQEEGYATIIPRSNGSSLQFRFTVPANLPASEESSSAYNLWRLNVTIKQDDTDLDRSFEIPVYDTGESSRRISIQSIDLTPKGVAEVTAESVLPIIQKGEHIVIYYPMLRKPGRSLGILLFGGIFAGVGYFLWGEGANQGVILYFMGGIFSLIGWGIVIFGGVYSAFNSLRIQLGENSLVSSRMFMGIALKHHRIDYSDIVAIKGIQSMTSTSGRKHTVEYRIVAELEDKKITLAEHIDSARSKARVIEYFEDKVFTRRAQ